MNSNNTKPMGYNKETLLAMLHNREVKIQFRKLNGDLRVLRGTLKLENTPKNTKIDNSRKPNLITLWDLDFDAFRSVRTDRIIDVL